MKLLFFILPGFSHIQPTLPVSQELIRHGEEIIYYTTRQFEQIVKDIGAKVRVIDDVFGINVMNGGREMFFKNLATHSQEANRLLPQVTTSMIQCVCGGVRLQSNCRFLKSSFIQVLYPYLTVLKARCPKKSKRCLW
jgi:hypothetical protein